MRSRTGKRNWKFVKRVTTKKDAIEFDRKTMKYICALDARGTIKAVLEGERLEVWYA